MPAMLLGNNVRVWGSFWESMHDVAVKKYLPSQVLVQWGAQGTGAPPASGSGIRLVAPQIISRAIVSNHDIWNINSMSSFIDR